MKRLVVSVLSGLLLFAPSAFPQASTTGVRADGAVEINPNPNTNRVQSAVRMTRFGGCPTNPGDDLSGPRATVHYKVTAAAQAKYNLPSQTIIKKNLDDTTRIPGSSVSHRLQATQAMSKALGRIRKGERIKVLIKISFTFPIVEVYTKTIALETGAGEPGGGWQFEQAPSGCTDSGDCGGGGKG